MVKNIFDKRLGDMANTGRDYEEFVAKMQQAILLSEQYIHQKNIKVETNKLIIDNSGIERQFDVYWEYEFGGLTYKTVIECKDYNSNVPVEKIDALIGKIRDIPDLKAVCATKKGFQSGAHKKAEANKIDLLIVREQNDSDWIDGEGRLLKRMCMNLICLFPARITRFSPTVDHKWIEENGISLSQNVFDQALNNEVFIEDIAKNEKYSLHELENSGRLEALNDTGYGFFNEKLESAFLVYRDLRLKLVEYSVEYDAPRKIQNSFSIDFTKMVLGVVEYLMKQEKRLVFESGIVQTE